MNTKLRKLIKYDKYQFNSKVDCTLIEFIENPELLMFDLPEVHTAMKFRKGLNTFINELNFAIQELKQSQGIQLKKFNDELFKDVYKIISALASCVDCFPPDTIIEYNAIKTELKSL